jgi:hypothetical protein
MHIKRQEPEKQGFNFLVQTFAVDFVPRKVFPELVLFTISVMPMNLLGEFASADIDGHRSIVESVDSRYIPKIFTCQLLQVLWHSRPQLAIPPNDAILLRRNLKTRDAYDAMDLLTKG